MENLTALKVVELRERLEALGLPSNGLKADLIERLKVHLEKTENAEEVKEAGAVADSSPRNNPSSPKPHVEIAKPADVSPRNSELLPSPAVVEGTTATEVVAVEQPADSRPSAAELARKRAERFGIPVITQEVPEKAVAPAGKPAVVLKSAKEQPEEVVHEDEHVVDFNDGDEAMEQDDAEVKKPKLVFDKYQELLASGIPEGSIVHSADFVIDSANFKRLEKVIETHGEAKVTEIVANVVNRINKEFENDRSKIRAPARLATSRLSFGLKSNLPRTDKTSRDDGKKSDYRSNKDDYRKDDKKSGQKWTDEEWEQWRKDQAGGKKKSNWGSTAAPAWKDDWKGGSKKGGYSKSSYSDEDKFESDVEEFIYRNKLDRRAAEAMRTESKGMVTYVMDQGFNISGKNDNPSKEVILRMHAYRKSKERSFKGGNQSYRSRSRSYSVRGGSRNQRSPSRDRPKYPSKSDSRDSRSRSRSYNRDRYDRDSRSASR